MAWQPLQGWASDTAALFDFSKSSQGQGLKDQALDALTLVAAQAMNFYWYVPPDCWVFVFSTNQKAGPGLGELKAIGFFLKFESSLLPNLI